MAKMVMPLSHTVFLPRQAAPMAQVKGVQLEPQLLKVKKCKNNTVCSGTLSITVTYQPSLPGSSEKIMEKMVLVPFQAECPGELPPCAPSGCQLSCSDTTWQMISPQAIELKTILTLVCEEVAEIPSIPLPVDTTEEETDLAIVPSDSEVAATMPNCCDFRFKDCPPVCKPPVPIMPRPLADDNEMRFAPKNDTLSMPAKKKPEPRVEQSCDFRFAAPAAPASRAVVDEQAKTEAATLEPPAQTAFRFSSEKNQPEAAIPVVEGQENRRHITNEDPLLDCRIYQPIPEEVRIERGLYFPSLPQCECEKPVRPTPPNCPPWRPCPPQRPEHRPEVPLPPTGSTPPVEPGPDENRPEVPLPPIGSTPPVEPGLMKSQNSVVAANEQSFDTDLSQEETRGASLSRMRQLPAPRTKKETVGNQYCLKFYLVQEGEDLSAVAEKQQVSQAALESANAVCEEDIRAGMILSIPEEKSEKNE